MLKIIVILICMFCISILLWARVYLVQNASPLEKDLGFTLAKEINKIMWRSRCDTTEAMRIFLFEAISCDPEWYMHILCLDNKERDKLYNMVHNGNQMEYVFLRDKSIKLMNSLLPD